MLRNKLALVALAAAAQIGILSTMIVADSLPYQFGETIRLKVVPVDPRDMFRGDYVVLGYEFSNLRDKKVSGLTDTNGTYCDHAGQPVYVLLVKDKDDDVWKPQEISVNRPSTGTYLRGQINGQGQIDCGIDAYFVQEGEGLQIEQAIREDKNAVAEVAVWNGQAKLKRVITN
jgi:uncharacterized membrane-anchored protein